MNINYSSGIIKKCEKLRNAIKAILSHVVSLAIKYIDKESLVNDCDV